MSGRPSKKKTVSKKNSSGKSSGPDNLNKPAEGGHKIRVIAKPDEILLKGYEVTRSEFVALIFLATDPVNFKLSPGLDRVLGRARKTAIFQAVCGRINLDPAVVQAHLMEPVDQTLPDAPAALSEQDWHRLFFVISALGKKQFSVKYEEGSNSLNIEILNEFARRDLSMPYSPQLRITVPEFSHEEIRSKKEAVMVDMYESEFVNYLMRMSHNNSDTVLDILRCVTPHAAKWLADDDTTLRSLDIPDQLFHEANVLALSGEALSDLQKLLAQLHADTMEMLFGTFVEQLVAHSDGAFVPDFLSENALTVMGHELATFRSFISLLVYNERQENSHWAYELAGMQPPSAVSAKPVGAKIVSARTTALTM